jgi:chromosome segregation ATPase
MIEPTIVNLARLQRQKAYFEREGYPTAQMQIHWQKTMEAIETAFASLNEAVIDLAATQDAQAATQAELATTQTELATTQTDLATTQDELATAVADIAAAQAALIVVQDDVTGLQTTVLDAVLKDQTAAWATPTGTFARTTFASYAGQTVSAIPTQAEVQTIDDAVKGLSQRFAALISDLRGNGVLT